MLQALLRERFKLAVHSETRDLPIYQLVAEKGKSKLKTAAAGATDRDGAIGPDEKGFASLTPGPWCARSWLPASEWRLWRTPGA